MRKSIYGAALLLAALPAVANAAFVINYPSTQPVPTVDPGRNNFVLGLAAAGITTFASTGASVTLNGSGPIKFEFFGNEALLKNKFTVGSLSFTTTQGFENNFTLGTNPTGTPFNIGTAFFTPGTFNPTFFSGSKPLVPITQGSTNFGIGLPAGSNPVAGSVATNTLWLMFDDTGSLDDNHDDLVVRATFVVPESSTWTMMILGFGVIGFAARRRSQQRISFV